MSVLAQQDYPDWGRQVSQSDIVLFNEINTPIAVGTSLPARFTGSSPWVTINFSSPATRARASFRWSADEAGTIITGSDQVVITSTAQALISLPVQGAWLNAFVELSAYPGDFSLQVVAVPGPVGNWTEALANTMINADGVTIAAGATGTFAPELVLSGWVTVNAQMRTGTVATGLLFTRRFDNTTDFIDRWRIPAFAPERRIYIPPLPLSLQIINNDAGAQTVDAHVLAGTPGLP